MTYLHYSCRPTFFFGHRGNAPMSLKIYFAQLILQNKELAAKVSSTITYLFELQKQVCTYQYMKTGCGNKYWPLKPCLPVSG